ncbi:MAG: hypothetical protein AB8G77_26085 [Rhodothermales bacterium]
MAKQRGFFFSSFSFALLAFTGLIFSACNAAEEPCSGAMNLRVQHEELLACAGWLGYVKDNVCEINYVNTIPATLPNTKVYGRASCVDGSILVATKIIGLLPRNIGPVEIATTIVHEAAHQLDECADREFPALTAERTFQQDLCRNVKAEMPACTMLAWENQDDVVALCGLDGM